MNTSRFDIDPAKHKNVHMDKNDSPNFCLAPWTSLYMLNNGEVSPCCHYSEYGRTGDLANGSIANTWNSIEMKQLRLDMLKGDKVIGNCAKCHRIEKAGENSFRQELFRTYGHLLKEVEQTSPDGSVDIAALRSLTVSTGTRCQLKCRMCGPWASSAWRNELGLGEEDFDGIDARVQTDVLNLISNSSSLEKLLFIGGEPLISAFHYEILELLLELNKAQSTELYYNSNLVQLKWKNQNVLEYWKKFPKVTLYVSIDATGDQFNFIRRGHDWSLLLENLRRVRAECPSIETYAFFTLSLCNYLELPEIMKTLLEENIFPINRILFNHVRRPAYMNAQNAPLDKKIEAKKKYIRFMKELLTTYEVKDAAHLIAPIKVYLKYLEEQEGSAEEYQKFLEFNQVYS